jgi:hypothetical protein
MKVEKKVIGNLTKCYSIAPLHYQGKDHLLVAAEKQDRCILFDMDGNEEDTLWTEPGGVMTMQQVPGTDGQFLATHQFYSPNDSKEAKIVIVTPKGKGNWERRTLLDLPFVHRFGIIERNGVRYLIACALKSGHEFKDDWSMPGKVFACELPDDLSSYNDAHQLKMEVIKEGMLKNHGYTTTRENGQVCAVVSCDNGIFLFTPPEKRGAKWEIKELLNTPGSDAVLVDLDGCGEKELAVISPFHGDKISIYKKKDGKFEQVYAYEKPAEFSHSIFGGMLAGVPAVVIGHRKGDRDLILFTWNAEAKKFQSEILDHDCGSANVYVYSHGGKDHILSTNREINEIAVYTVS